MSSMWIQLIHWLPWATSCPPLPIGAPGPSLKIGVMIFRAPAPGASTIPVRTIARRTPGCFERCRRLLALPAEHGQEIDARRARLVELFVAARTVIADRRALDEDLRDAICACLIAATTARRYARGCREACA